MGNTSNNQKHICGFTLLELIITLAIIAIALTIAVPSFSEKYVENRVTTMTEQLYQDLLFARSEAVKRNANITLSFTQNSTWCYGINDSGTCSCNISGSCTLNGKEKVGSYKDYSNSSLTVSTNLIGANFDPARGVIEKSGSPVSGNITFSSSGVSATVKLNVLGRPSICSNNFSQYPAC